MPPGLATIKKSLQELYMHPLCAHHQHSSCLWYISKIFFFVDQGPSITQQRTAAAEAASGGPVVAPAAAAAPAALPAPSGDADKQSPSKSVAPAAAALPPVPTVPTASGFERWALGQQSLSLISYVSQWMPIHSSSAA